MLRSMTLAAVAAFAMTAAMPANAQMVCGERAEIVKALESGHEEQKTATALSGNGGLVELYTASGGSWTLLMTLPGGPTCLLGSGEEWEGWRSLTDPKNRRATADGEVVDHT
ncbi:MAG: hypothetical protein OEU46_23715 [Alphaproteobacteria bacterium]|nr:hypothetical protein [Alphaproteobacteria bacterium]